MALARTARVLQEAIDARVFPGAVVEVGTHSGVRAAFARGSLSYDSPDPVDTDTVYDLASLTKVLCTAALTATLLEHGTLALEQAVGGWSPAWMGPERQGVTLRHLLEHASGLPGYRPYFERWQGRQAFEAAIGRERLEYEPGSRSVYSDPGFILLGLILERAGGMALDAQFDDWRRSNLPPDLPLCFLPPIEWRVRVAPTEFDARRGGLLRGEVHDENAAALGGVAGHAGLFGTAAAVGACARWWMVSAARSSLAATFMRRSGVPGSSRALGWDTMLPTSSCGTRMSPSAVGHTGFTGTSLWIDPPADRYIVCLTNRVHPHREGDAMARVRPAIHDAVAEDLTRA
jgi:CubicO group peptidase (beta-lactamase class C family)